MNVDLLDLLSIEHSLSKNMSLKKFEGFILPAIVNPKHMLFHEQTYYPTHRPDHQSVLSSHLANTMFGCLAKTLLLIDLFAVIKRAHSAATS